jgi:hypothetical protein
MALKARKGRTRGSVPDPFRASSRENIGCEMHKCAMQRGRVVGIVRPPPQGRRTSGRGDERRTAGLTSRGLQAQPPVRQGTTKVYVNFRGAFASFTNPTARRE